LTGSSSIAYSGLRVWTPDYKAQTFQESAIIAAMQANQLVTVRDPEMLPFDVATFS